MNTGLFLLRRIDPPARLYAQLDEIGHITEFEDGTKWVNDAEVRDVALNHSITGWADGNGQWVQGCTVGWGIFDSDLNKHAFYTKLPNAVKALETAKPVIITEFELEQEETEVTPGGAKVTTEVLPAQGRRKPFEA